MFESQINRIYYISRVFIFYFLISVCLFSSFAVYAQMSPKEARAQANAALAQGDFKSAITYLTMLIDYLGDSTNPQTISAMAVIYYRLGVCYFFTGDFSEAEKTFQIYLKKYPRGSYVPEIYIYIADGNRFQQHFDKAVKTYKDSLKKYRRKYSDDLKTDILCSIARCYLSRDDWAKAIPYLLKIYRTAPDSARRNWAATLWTVSCLKELKLPQVYNLVYYLLFPDSFAARSVALNMAALEAGDTLFADERYRDALWVYRLVYPKEEVLENVTRYLRSIRRKAERLKKRGGQTSLRKLLYVQERIGETEASLKALEEVKNYSIELKNRIARSYMETFQYRPALEMFYYLHTITEKELSDECLYLAFRCALNLKKWDKVLELGKEYMDKFPKGDYFDPLTLAMGQVYARRKEWRKVINHFTKVLKMSPNHEDKAECIFLLGYAYFMEEQFSDTVTCLRVMNRDFPGNHREEDGTYWIAMALLFDSKYAEGAEEFDYLLEKWPNTRYKEDATFRRAVCDYGLSKFIESEIGLKNFVAAFPKSKLVGEAYMMLGDIAGFAGELKQAVEMFQKALEGELNIELYNYCSFRCGEIMFDGMKDYDNVIPHFKKYIEKNREGSNIPQAVFFIGRSMWQKDEKLGTLEYYQDTVKKFGNDRKALGVDMILEEWISKTKGVGEDLKRQAWDNLEKQIREAEKKSKKPLALRLTRALTFKPRISKFDKEKIIKKLLRPENIADASPAVLQMIMDNSLAQNNQSLGTLAAKAIVETFPETDYGLEARMYLGNQALKDEDYDTAISHFNVVKNIFAADILAASAILTLGDIYLKQKKYDRADNLYKSILAVKDWKKFWPQALYGRGQCAEAKREYTKACAYYERIYLMYSHYKKWTSKAYLQRAKALVKLREYNKALQTLEEMLSLSEMEKYPETQEAKRLVKDLKRKI